MGASEAHATARALQPAVGDHLNDWDFRYPCGRVVAAGDGWFEVEWQRITPAPYVKRHVLADIGDRPGGLVFVWRR